MQQVANSRKIAASYLKYKDLAGTEVDAVLKEHGSFLMQMDKRFKLEAQFFRSMLDGDAVQRLQEQVMACLPTGPGISASAVAGRLATVTQSDLFKWVGLGGQSQALSVAATVRSLAAVKPPSFSVTNDPFLAICREKCRFFVSYRDSSAAGSDDGALIGEAAVQKLIEKAEAKVKNKEELVYDDVAMCIAFAWLLDAADRDKVSKLTQEASCVHVKGEPATASASSSRKAPTPNKETCKSMVQSLFRKKKSS